MELYKNLKGDFGVNAYEIGDDFIKVWFKDATYLYNYEKPGTFHVEQMKILAITGKGLSTYISRNVKDNYIAKYKN